MLLHSQRPHASRLRLRSSRVALDPVDDDILINYLYATPDNAVNKDADMQSVVDEGDDAVADTTAKPTAADTSAKFTATSSCDVKHHNLTKLQICWSGTTNYKKAVTSKLAADNQEEMIQWCLQLCQSMIL
ncbi:hypothetical protein Plhal703r1_c27g0112301 [Plasmopara halstedii]